MSPFFIYQVFKVPFVCGILFMSHGEPPGIFFVWCFNYTTFATGFFLFLCVLFHFTINPFFSDKTYICFLKISGRSLWHNSSRHLPTPLFVDWLPTGQWSAVSPTVLKRGSLHSLHCQQGGTADGLNLDAAKGSFQISPVFLLIVAAG